MSGGPASFLARLRTRRDEILLPEATSGQEQWQRTVLNENVRRHLRALGPSGLRAAEISGAGQSDLGWRSFTSLDYPEFDLCAPLTVEDRFDVVICEQVIEHVVDPGAAVRNLLELCVPGGQVVVSTPFLIRVHEIWGMQDYWRFTPRGLRTLLERAGLVVDHVDSWGNRRCLNGNLRHWPAQRPWMTLRNEPDMPLQVWAFAHRPTDDEHNLQSQSPPSPTQG